jgi:hypothetical protein
MKIEELIKKYNVNFYYETFVGTDDVDKTLIEIPCVIVGYHIEDYYYEEKGEDMYLYFELQPLNNEWMTALDEDDIHDIWHSLKTLSWGEISSNLILKQ